MHFMPFWLIATAGIARFLSYKPVSLPFSVTRGKSLSRMYSARDPFFLRNFYHNLHYLTNPVTPSPPPFFCVRINSLCNTTRIFSFRLPLVIASNFEYHMTQKDISFVQNSSEHQ